MRASAESAATPCQTVPWRMLNPALSGPAAAFHASQPLTMQRWSALVALLAVTIAATHVAGGLVRRTGHSVECGTAIGGSGKSRVPLALSKWERAACAMCPGLSLPPPPAHRMGARGRNRLRSTQGCGGELDKPCAAAAAAAATVAPCLHIACSPCPPLRSGLLFRGGGGRGYQRRRVRREIGALMTQPGLARERSLFLQALAAMQAAPWQDKESYYLLAAIHGVPYQAYDGDVNPASPYIEGQEFMVNGSLRMRRGGEQRVAAGRGGGLGPGCGAEGEAAAAAAAALPTALPAANPCPQATARTDPPSSPPGTVRSCCTLRQYCSSTHGRRPPPTAAAPTPRCGAQPPTASPCPTSTGPPWTCCATACRSSSRSPRLRWRRRAAAR